MQRCVFVGLALFAVLGCQPRMLTAQDSVGGYRVRDAATVALINRTQGELVIYAYTWSGHQQRPMDSPVRLVTSRSARMGNGRDSAKETLFDSLHMPEHEVGAYSLEVMSDDSDVRLAVIDLDREQMAEAKDSKNLRMVFRESRIDVSIGTRTFQHDWLRPPPRSRPYSRSSRTVVEESAISPDDAGSAVTPE